MMSFANGGHSLLLVCRRNKVSSHGNLAPNFSEVLERKVKMLTSILEGKVQVIKLRRRLNKYDCLVDLG